MLSKIKELYISFVALLLMVIITSCGYTLRGSFDLPPSLSQISVFSNSYSELVNAVNDSLLNKGIKTTSSNDKSLIRIIINTEQFKRRQLSMSISGRVNEYELIYDVTYEINMPNEKSLSDSIILYRDYSFDENNVMGNSDREAYIKKEMVSTAATLIFNKLRAVAN